MYCANYTKINLTCRLKCNQHVMQLLYGEIECLAMKLECDSYCKCQYLCE